MTPMVKMPPKQAIRTTLKTLSGIGSKQDHLPVTDFRLAPIVPGGRCMAIERLIRLPVGVSITVIQMQATRQRTR
jgi:hypothetical protein